MALHATNATAVTISDGGTSGVDELILTGTSGG